MKPRKKTVFQKTDKPWKIIDDPDLSTDFSHRVVVVDAETEEVLDNANGYGYKGNYNAERGYEWKNSNEGDHARWHHAKEAATRWRLSQSPLIEAWYDLRVIAWERGDHLPSDSEFDALMSEHGKKVSFTARDFARYL